MSRAARKLLCWIGLHDWSDRDRAHYDHEPTRRPLLVRFCYGCASVEGVTLTDEQCDEIDRELAEKFGPGPEPLL